MPDVWLLLSPKTSWLSWYRERLISFSRESCCLRKSAHRCHTSGANDPVLRSSECCPHQNTRAATTPQWAGPQQSPASAGPLNITRLRAVALVLPVRGAAAFAHSNWQDVWVGRGRFQPGNAAGGEGAAKYEAKDDPGALSSCVAGRTVHAPCTHH